jgi:hypothetical protein
MSTQTIPPLSKTRQLLNKVPEVTIYFWIIKCLCTTIGETMSDNLMGRFAVGGDSATPEQLQIALYKVAAITVIFARHSSSSLIRRLPVASPGLPSRTSLLRTIRTVILSGDPQQPRVGRSRLDQGDDLGQDRLRAGIWLRRRHVGHGGTLLVTVL